MKVISSQQLINEALFLQPKNSFNMSHRSIKVKVLKETKSKVTIKFMSLNRKMPVPKEEFEARVEEGVYDVVNPEMLEAK